MIIQALSSIRPVKFKLVKSFNDSSNSIKTIICESKNKNIAENFLLSTKNENETLELTVQLIDENVSRVNSILKYTGTRPEMSQKRGLASNLSRKNINFKENFSNLVCFDEDGLQPPSHTPLTK